MKTPRNSRVEFLLKNVKFPSIGLQKEAKLSPEHFFKSSHRLKYEYIHMKYFYYLLIIYKIGWSIWRNYRGAYSICSSNKFYQFLNHYIKSLFSSFYRKEWEIIEWKQIYQRALSPQKYLTFTSWAYCRKCSRKIPEKKNQIKQGERALFTAHTMRLSN